MADVQFVNWTINQPQPIYWYTGGKYTSISGNYVANSASPREMLECPTYVAAADRTITFNAATGYPNGYQATLYNSGTRRYTIIVSGRTSFYLFPGQTAVVYNINQLYWGISNSTVWDVPNPLGTSATTALSVYVDHANGSANYDGLSTSSAYNTVQNAIAFVDKYVDTVQQGVQIVVLSSNFMENGVAVTKRLRGFHVYSITSSSVLSPASHIWRIGYGQTALTCRDWSGAIISGFQMQANYNTVKSIAANIITSNSAHQMNVGDAIWFKNSGGALPTGITAETNYYIIAANFSATTFQVSLTPGGAAAGVSGGSGTNTFAVCYAIGISASQTGVCDVGASNAPGVTTPSMIWGWMPGVGQGWHINSTNGGSVGYSTNSYHQITDGCDAHWQISASSKMIATGANLDIPAAVKFQSAFLNMNLVCTTITAGFTFTGAGAGACTGAQYNISYNSVWVGSGVTLPGIGGSTSTGGYAI